MAGRAWLKVVAALMLAAGAASAAQAQNYDGGVLFRFGAFGSGAFLNFDVKQPVIGSASSNGGGGGLSIGLDYVPSPYWIIGIEADVVLGDARGLFNDTSYGLDYLATIRGRFGVYPHPDWLIYGTAGGAWLGFEAQQPGSGNKAVETIPGLTVGGGVEYNWDHVILFGEYNYATLGSRQFTINDVRHDIDADAHTVKLGLKFKVGHDHDHGYGRHYEPYK